MPGQFVEVLPPANSTFLRRPISVCNIDVEDNTLWLLVRRAGNGTAALNDCRHGDSLNIIYPLGHGYSTTIPGSKALLVGGGVGVAPLLYLGKTLAANGVDVRFLIGARSSCDLLMLDYLRAYGDVIVTTDDGSKGHHGVVTTHPTIISDDYNQIYCCGPMPMMKSVAKIAAQRQINCEVSLENVMGCGIGACLCCVENTIDKGNVCVCSEGPVFNISRLDW